jgi:catechol 2,3-dioxygenase-like lactoylglutathione lyase family enzyme
MQGERPPLLGIVETAIYVQDLDRAQSFYERVFGWQPIFAEDGRLTALGVAPSQVLLLFREGQSLQGAGEIPGHGASGKTHLAFGIDRGSVEAWRAHLQACGIPIESDIPCGGDGRSVYFRDPDGHLLELVTRGCWKVF